MKYCKKCGTKLDEDAVFCPECGTPVVRTKKDAPAAQNLESETGSGTRMNAGNFYGRFDLEKLPEGHVIDERYEIIRKLGQGSFGAVYLAYDNHMEIRKALKVIPEAVTNDKEAMLSLKKEASIMVKLNHNNIVRVYDFHYNNEIKYIDMEYVDGTSLADLKLQKKGKKFPEEEVKQYAQQIAEGLEYAHNQRVIHKDIKPQNIMLAKDGTIKLMDFGIAETVHSSMSRLKNTGSSGTLVYMSPEQLRGKDVGKESDIYAVGATLYELLTGNPPFHQGDVTYQIINENPQSIAGISEQLNEVVMKCLEKEREQRFSNCYELRIALKKPPIPKAKDIVQEPENKHEETKPVPPKIVSGSKNKEKSVVTKVIGSAIVAIIIVVIGILTYHKTAKEKMIRTLIARVDRAISNEQMLSPADDNALYYLNQLKELDPENDSIIEIRNRISDYFRRKGNDAFYKNDYTSALDYYQKGSLVAPDEPYFDRDINNVKTRMAEEKRLNQERIKAQQDSLKQIRILKQKLAQQDSLRRILILNQKLAKQQQKQSKEYQQFSYFSLALKNKLSSLGYEPKKVILYDDFSNNINNWATGNYSDENESIKSDGRYHIEELKENQGWNSWVNKNYNDIIISCSVKFESGNVNYGGGVEVENNAGTRYYLQISAYRSDHEYNIAYLKNNQWFNDSWITSSAIISNYPNHLEMIILDHTIYYFVNGQFLKSYTYSENLAGDKIGFYVGGKMEYSFDDLRVVSIGLK